MLVTYALLWSIKRQAFSSQLGLHAACACFVLAAKVAEIRETGKTGGIWDHACSKKSMQIVFPEGNIDF